MKIFRSIIFYSVFVLWIFSVVAGGVRAQEDYPDFLEEDSTEIDFLDDSPQFAVKDPLEPMNRVFFEFNDILYEWLLKPTMKGYSWIFPLELREAFGNFFVNLAMPVRLVNSLLQGDMEKTGVVLERFLINSTVGVYGFADVADEEFDIEPRRADFGQTLGKWGLGEGIYFCWPVIGPSNVRDSVGFVADVYSHPLPYFTDDRVFLMSYYVTDKVNTLSLNPDVYEDLKRYSLDPYVAARQAYYEYRKALIENE